MATQTKVVFERRPAGGGEPAILGFACQDKHGFWRFFPKVFGRLPSRHSYETLEGCIPRWVGYPGRCESRYVS